MHKFSPNKPVSRLKSKVSRESPRLRKGDRETRNMRHETLSVAGQALAEYLIVIPPLVLAALGLASLFRAAWASLFERMLLLLGPWP